MNTDEENRVMMCPVACFYFSLLLFYVFYFLDGYSPGYIRPQFPQYVAIDPNQKKSEVGVSLTVDKRTSKSSLELGNFRKGHGRILADAK